MLDRLASHEFYCFLNGYSGYNQILIAPKDQEKTTFTCHESKIQNILSFCHEQACEGHFSAKKTTTKVLQCGFYWPTIF